MDKLEELRRLVEDRESELRQLRSEAQRATVLVRVVDLMHNSDHPDEGISAALDLCVTTTGSDAWVLVGATGTGHTEVLAASDPALLGKSWPDGSPALSQAQRVSDLHETEWAAGMASDFGAFHALLSTPIEMRFQPDLVIGLLSKATAAFSSDDMTLLTRVGNLLREGIANRLLIERNAALSMVVDAKFDVAIVGSDVMDQPFETLRRNFGQVVDWQSEILAITKDLLETPSRDADTAIENALARIGALADADRTYVLLLRDGHLMDNTHEWVASGIAPMKEHLQRIPATLLDDSLDDLLAGRALHVPDVFALEEGSPVREILEMQHIRSLLIVPMLRDGKLAGFLGHDAVRKPKRYLPLEIQLLQSVCTAIGSVIDHVKAENLAEMAQESLQATLRAIPDLVIEQDRDGRYVAVYEGPAQPAFRPTSEVIGRLPEDVFPPHLASYARKIMQTVDREGRLDGQTYQIEVEGELRTFRLSAASKVLRGEPVGYVMVTRDITHRIEETRQLQRLGKIAELTSNMVIITDKFQRITWLNPAFEGFTGWTLDEVRGKRPESFLASEHTDGEELSRITNLLRDGKPVRSELLNRTRSGKDYWISEDIQPLFGADNAIEGYVAVQTDITELKQSHLRALRDRALAMDASSDGIAITDETGHYVYMNPAHRNMFGIGVNEDVGLIEWKQLYTPDALKRFFDDNWPHLMEYGVWRGELFGLHRDGHTVAQEVSLTLRERGILCITRDISQRLQLEVERTRLRESLQIAQSREMIAQLTSSVAHDLNNLVAVVAGSTRLLNEMCDDRPDAKAGLSRIMRATQTATDLVAGLARLGRPQRLRAQLELSKIVHETVDLLGTQRVRAHNVTVKTPDSPCPVWANLTELFQVVLNLALNACQAADEDNTVTLTVLPQTDALPAQSPDAGHLHPDLSYTVFMISDTGAGIDPLIKPRLFDRYFTTKGASGTGLGLPIVAGILRDNDAALWIDSTVGHGTVITVAWPSSGGDTHAVSQTAAATPGHMSLAGHRILVVDDLPDVADVISEMLETADAVCIAVSDPKDALELLTENPGLWSALVTDQDMPTLSGIDLARAAAACDPPVATVLVTALSDSVGKDAHLFDTILSKPATAEQLIEAVKRIIVKRPPRDAS